MNNIYKKLYVSVCSFFLTRDFPVLTYNYIHAQVLRDVLTERAATVHDSSSSSIVPQL